VKRVSGRSRPGGLPFCPLQCVQRPRLPRFEGTELSVTVLGSTAAAWPLAARTNQPAMVRGGIQNGLISLASVPPLLDPACVGWNKIPSGVSREASVRLFRVLRNGNQDCVQCDSHGEKLMSRPRKSTRERMSEWVLHCAVDQHHIRRSKPTKEAALKDACAQLLRGHRIVGPNEYYCGARPGLGAQNISRSKRNL
jgi:hypothetical protein